MPPNGRELAELDFDARFLSAVPISASLSNRIPSTIETIKEYETRNQHSIASSLTEKVTYLHQQQALYTSAISHSHSYFSWSSRSILEQVPLQSRFQQTNESSFLQCYKLPFLLKPWLPLRLHCLCVYVWAKRWFLEVEPIFRYLRTRSSLSTDLWDWNSMRVRTCRTGEEDTLSILYDQFMNHLLFRTQ